MALNKFMHPRNKYFDNPPDFSKLSEKYPEFKNHTSTSSSGKVSIDFKDPEALRSLTCTLLKEDFGLDVHLPIDRIIPTVPLRLNYILWIEDLLAKSKVSTDEEVTGIDIGSGASCIYPLLGFKTNGWKFVASEVDALSLHFAKENVQANNAEDHIKVYEAAENTMLLEIVADNPRTSYHFTMCNPPFFGNMLEAQGIMSRTMERAEPKSVCTASEIECIADGGEVEFVKRMIQDSLKLRQKILWFTSMVGKKTSLPLLKQELHKHKISHFTTTEFCQGRTMRWGIAWTFHEEVDILPPAKRFKPSKEKPPLTIPVPPKYIEKVLSTHPKAKGQLNMVKFLTKEIKKCLRNLEITFIKSQNAAALTRYELTATKNTWSKQRQKRRQQQRLKNDKNTEIAEHSDQKADTTINDTSNNDEDKMEFLFKCFLGIKMVDGNFVMEINWIEGKSRELMHQLGQFFRNFFQREISLYIQPKLL
ncbi:RNA N6-adenosine-methyltransferase mettl16-like [Anneissia japonica]|uniref:RNA N6-adenosine-methyltransferase mettl16-like n=1 Tax=Anneissia japonica TaxID=1529436 RepID=UPI00142572E8|nr:RNA N6-adenosine-methyltransferase mettl16-like [Anneissia japonica]XP_033119341.1 RNA N6-adenosine-methyltransferase mettl16-like [Anneissia japonica]XP_033119342.1 RNA N6-adenosine-methyltransferase mettl16-like [Anneissia japonica]